jgi:hypothetical protein
MKQSKQLESSRIWRLGVTTGGPVENPENFPQEYLAHFQERGFGWTEGVFDLLEEDIVYVFHQWQQDWTGEPSGCVKMSENW